MYSVLASCPRLIMQFGRTLTIDYLDVVEDYVVYNY